MASMLLRALILVALSLVRDAGPVFLHSLTDALLVVIGFRSAFRGGADFLFSLVREVSELSFVFHNE